MIEAGSLVSGVLSGLIVAATSYVFGQRQFFIQRKADRIQDRYVTKGLAEPIDELTYYLGICNENYLRAGELIKLLRASLLSRDVKTFRQLLTTIQGEFTKIPATTTAKFFVTRVLSLNDENRVVLEWIVRAEADIQSFDQYLRYTLPTEVEGSLGHLGRGRFPEKDVEPFIKDLIDDLNREFEETNRHWALIEFLNGMLIIVDQTNPSTIGELLTIKDSSDFKKILTEMREQYKKIFGGEPILQETQPQSTRRNP